MNEKEIIYKVISNEGGYVNNPNDPGGETKFGISKKQYPDLDIEKLEEEDAFKIYRDDYWDRYNISMIGDSYLAYKVLDMSVNLGPTTAVRLLQEALNILGSDLDVDGFIGPKTLKEVNSIEPLLTLNVLRLLQQKRYLYLIVYNPKLKEFLKGWMKRSNE